ncbi:MAG: Loki-CTERM sorting domain-containing protein [Promethearchaeota archaeon]
MPGFTTLFLLGSISIGFKIIFHRRKQREKL